MQAHQTFGWNLVHWSVGFLEHAAALVVGFAMMVIGLGLGVTMIMLPVGIVVGLLGVLLFIGGLFARFNSGE